jgi:predicted nucleic acid-binding protein
MRFVFDTNVIVSALLIEQSKPAQVLYSALESGEILLSVDRYISNEQRDAFLIALV